MVYFWRGLALAQSDAGASLLFLLCVHWSLPIGSLYARAMETRAITLLRSQTRNQMQAAQEGNKKEMLRWQHGSGTPASCLNATTYKQLAILKKGKDRQRQSTEAPFSDVEAKQSTQNGKAVAPCRTAQSRSQSTSPMRTRAARRRAAASRLSEAVRRRRRGGSSSSCSEHVTEPSLGLSALLLAETSSAKPLVSRRSRKPVPAAPRSILADGRAMPDTAPLAG